MSSFSKQIWVVPPLNPSKFFSDPPFGFSVTTDPPFVLLKIKWSPQNPPSPLPQAINNHRSLGTNEIIFCHLNMEFLKRADSWYAATLKVIHLRSHWQYPSAIDDYLVHVSSTSDSFFLSALYIRLLGMKIVGSPLACMCNASHTSNLEKKTKYNTLAVY